LQGKTRPAPLRPRIRARGRRHSGQWNGRFARVCL